MANKIEESHHDIKISGLDPEGLRTLFDISQSLHRYRDLYDLILYILQRATEVTEAEMASVILYDEETDELVFYSSTDTAERREKLGGIRIPADQGIASSVLKSGKGELIPDISKDLRHFKGADSITEFKTKSMVVVPLKTTEKTIGVLEVLNKREGDFGEKDLNSLLALSPMTAIAIDNARMYTELELAYNELKLIDIGKDDIIRQAKDEVDFLRREVRRSYHFDQIIGSSERILKVFKLCENAIDSDVTVLIEGETGTGKELIARAIHYNGPRKEKPFVIQNCAGIPDALLASELFGHKRGAYTGAFKDKKGLFEVADGGTIFLDEVGEMSAAMQPSLLRVLQDGDIRPLGAETGRQVDIRLISATNKNLSQEVKKGGLREDLFYRLSVFPIKLPPLRERIADIPTLANHFLSRNNKKSGKSVKGFSQNAMDCLIAYSFPGNVRELENEIERAFAMVDNGDTIDVSDLSEKIGLQTVLSNHGVKLKGSLKQMVETLEKSTLLKALDKHGNNKTRAAEELGLSRYGLTKKLNRYGF